MLVVDLNALQTVNVLYFVDDVFLNGRRTLDGKYVGRCDDAVGKRCSGTHGIVLLDKYLLRQRYKILALLAGLRRNDNLTVASLHLAHGHLTVDF